MYWGGNIIFYFLIFKNQNQMKKINAKFKSNCHETGKVISKGEVMLYNYDTRKCYCMTSKKAENYHEAESIKGYCDAQENAYFEQYENNSHYNF